MGRKRRLAIRFGPWLLMGLMALAGCLRARSEHGGERVAGRIVLHVAAASDLQAVLPVLITAFQADERGIEVVPVFGASGQLAAQIEAGAPFDVFLSANSFHVERLSASKDVDSGSVRPYAVGALVLAVGPGLREPVNGMADLNRADIKAIAIANPDTAPYGAAARQALQRAGLWERLQPKLAVAGSARQALAYVESGDAEAGLVSRSIADAPGVRVVAVDPTLHDPIVQALGVVAQTSHRREAEAFVRFVLGDAGQKVFRSHGFQIPAGP